MEAILDLVWAFLNSPIGITLVVSAVGSIAAAVYAKKPLWKKYEGVLISAVKMAEKAVPDDSESAGLQKLDAALEYAIDVLEDMSVKVKKKDIPELIAGLSEMHEKVEADGVLGPVVEE